jgi:uncharacterized protein YndB with AHSA1/START domain
VFERTLSHSAMAVWDAITNPAKLSKWFFEVELELKPGARMIIRFRDEHNTETYGKVVTVVPGSLFEFIWEGSDGEPDEFARWEIFPESATRTRLVLTYSRLTEKYATGAPAGFHIFLDQLEEYLGGRTTPFPNHSGDNPEQMQLQGEYQKQIGKVGA